MDLYIKIRLSQYIIAYIGGWVLFFETVKLLKFTYQKNFKIRGSDSTFTQGDFNDPINFSQR